MAGRIRGSCGGRGVRGGEGGAKQTTGYQWQRARYARDCTKQ